MIYNHGVRAAEKPTNIAAPVQVQSALPVIIGTAPVHRKAFRELVNNPVLAYSYDEAVEKLGYSDDWEKFTLCQSMYIFFKEVSVAPVVFVNVLDPDKHSKDTGPVEWDCAAGKEYSFSGKEVVPDSVKVMKESQELVKGTDYVLAVDEEGTVTVALLPGSSYYSEPALTVQAKEISFDREDMIDEIVGGYSAADGKNRGISCAADVYPAFQMVPGQLVAPGWSQYTEVSAALQAATSGINEEFTAITVIDVDCSASGATKCEEFARQKERQCVIDEQAVAVWPKVKSGDRVYYYSALYSAAVARMDALNSGVPDLSPSNISIPVSATVLEDGTEIRIDKPRANDLVNAFGGVTAVNYGGWKAWGNNTAAYPATKDPKDRWICARRFFNYYRNRLILIYADKVDQPTNTKLIEAICDNENVWFNAMTSGLHIAGGRISYDEAKNPLEQIVNGSVVFDISLATYLPAEDICFEIEFDPSILQEALAQ